MTIGARAQERASKWWLVPVVLMACMLTGLGTLVAIATDDPSFSVEHDYYRKALTWDRHQAQAARNRALGWTLTVDLEGGGASNRGEVRARLAVGGEAIREADIPLEAFHNARAGNVRRVQLTEQADGNYAAEVPFHRSGLWELRFRVRHRGQEFTETVRRDVTIGAAR